jgi:hypothetical protein
MADDSADQAGKDPLRLATLAWATALLTALCGSPVRADTATPNAAEAGPVADYSDPAHWICRPGRADACAVDLDATIIAEDGSMTREAFQADPYAPIDCFYVYPTVSREPTGNADFAIDRDLTRTVVQQFARFGARCRLFAPVYRQITIPGLIAEFSGKPMPMSRELAYADVLAAWRSYLANDNHGRGFVLVGHSQGTGVLSRLVREEIDDKPIQSQMVSALLLGGGGWGVPVKSGDAAALVFPHTPLCRTNSDIGCIIGFSSFRAESPPAMGTLFEKSPEGMHPACANPAALAGGAAPLDAYLSASGETITSEAKDPFVWTNPSRAIETPFVKVPGLLNARCVEDGQVVYLAVSRNAVPNGPRVGDIKGDLIINGKLLPDWGLHLVVVNLTMGNLLEVVGDETRAYLAQAKKQ